jgi:hypothetical protein
MMVPWSGPGTFNAEGQVIPILLIVVVVLILFRGRRAPTTPPGAGISGCDPIQLILLIVMFCS